MKHFNTPCVYLLSGRLSTHFYIGYSNDPFHRLRQHNGEISGGAKRTKNKGPWKLHGVVSGFTDNCDALRFEWALQHPSTSKWLRSDRRYHHRNINSRTQLASMLAQRWGEDIMLHLL